MPTVTEWTLAIVSNIIHFGFIIAILYTLRRFYQQRYSQALQKRFPLLIYLLNICFIFYLLYHITDKIAYIYGEIEFNFYPILNGEQVGQPLIISFISAVFYIFSLHGMVIMWIARSWILYFNCQYGLELRRSKWGVHLNNQYPDTLWFVKHRKDYGSNRVIYQIAIAWYIINALFQAFLLFKYPNVSMIYDSASLLTKFMISVIIWNKTPSFNDIFGIKKEMQRCFRVSGIALLLYIGWLIRLVIVGYNLWVFMVIQFIFGIIAGIMALTVNGFIFLHPNYKHLISITFRSGRFRAPSSSPGSDTSQGQKVSLSQTLENEQLIEGFFAHLCDEFSVELLLALVEFKQFHDLMVNDDEFMASIEEIISVNPEISRICNNILSRISLADKIPKSSIIYENHRDNDEDNQHIKRYLDISRDLFNKYVSTKAELEVNLSYKCRQKITSFIEEYSDLTGAVPLSGNEQVELFMLFNKAADELYRLLHASYARYMIAKRQTLFNFNT